MSSHEYGNQPLPKSSVYCMDWHTHQHCLCFHGVQAADIAETSNEATAAVMTEKTAPMPISEIDETDAEDVDQALAALEQIVVRILPCSSIYQETNLFHMFPAA